MDFYSTNSVENWTSNRIFEHYQTKLKGNRTKLLDSIKKDLQKVVVSPNFDNARRNKAQEIIDRWKDWSTISGTFDTPEKNLKRPRITKKINVKKVKNLATGSKTQINEIHHVTLVQDYIHNNEMDSTANLQSEESPLKASIQTPRDMSPLMTTPNKRPLEKEVQQYSEDISVVCAYGKPASELALEIGDECAIELSSDHDIIPSVWTPGLEEYLDSVLKETGNNFKTRLYVKKPDELFQLYCEKILVDFYHLVDIHHKIDRKIGERKFIIYQISSIFKFYETTFFTLEFDWIESHSHSSKITKSETNSGIVKVDAKAIRNSDGLEIWHMEVAGGPSDATDKQTLGDTKKTIRTDILNLIEVLRNHIDCNVQHATKIKVFCTLVVGTRMTLYSLSMLPDGRFLSVELATAPIPFSFHVKQEELMGEINRSVIRSEKTVRDVLKIPEGIFEKY
ncbi:13143_t:CDS:2 [Dentiscutata heterogama]|uniref:13143_t:CDS:1 n=1 Tax=Dentiscutata heterogama TaxID=1316150 RepID=A0ACA9KJI9_9GLOM|nr:13143_t:CDS:2 [Dentiscutata heterogama]